LSQTGYFIERLGTVAGGVLSVTVLFSLAGAASALQRRNWPRSSAVVAYILFTAPFYSLVMFLPFSWAPLVFALLLDRNAAGHRDRQLRSPFQVKVQSDRILQ
jgi:hypothetical protein